MSTLLTIGETASRSGVAASALRYYEERGLIASVRAGSGHRRFPRPVLRRIAFIVFAQRVGLTLDEIAGELAKLPPDRAPTRRDWSRLSSTWTSRIDARIAELERLKAGLTECIGCGCLSLERCRLANPDDRAAQLGPGPRYWVGDRPATTPGAAGAAPRACAGKCKDRQMSRRDLAHVSTALWELAGGTAGAGIALADIDEAIGRSRDDMRTPLNLQSLYDEGLVEQLADGTWALTPEGVQRHRDDEGYAGR